MMFDRILWNGWFRFVCFWALVMGVPSALDLLFDISDFDFVGATAWMAITSIGTPEGAAIVWCSSNVCPK